MASQIPETLEKPETVMLGETGMAAWKSRAAQHRHAASSSAPTDRVITTPRAIQRLTSLLFLALLLACARREAKPLTPARKAPLPLAESRVTDIIPTTEGSAYLLASDSGVWYLRGAEAVRVSFNETGKGLPDEGAPDHFYGLTITPTADGGAYATLASGRATWYLRESKAFPVVESGRLTSPAHTVVPRDKYFSLYVMEMRRRRAAEEQAGSDIEEPEPEGPS
jgi:hypothetical protein